MLVLKFQCTSTFEVITINPDKIRDVIGKGGATIRQITEETKAAIDIEDNGTVRVFGETKAAAKAEQLRNSSDYC